MKKILLLLIILIFSFFINGSYSTADNNPEYNHVVERFKREIYLKNMVAEIESESEVKIPGYVDMKYIEFMYNLGKKLDIPTRTTFRLVFKESSFIDTVKSTEGAEGFLQVMPDTQELYAKALCVDTLNLDVNQRNIYIGLNMLKDLYNYWSNDMGKPASYAWRLTLASYNAGLGRVLEYDGVPPFKETIKYIEFILRAHTISNNIGSNTFIASK